jgi:hypothetical protein
MVVLGDFELVVTYKLAYCMTKPTTAKLSIKRKKKGTIIINYSVALDYNAK